MPQDLCKVVNYIIGGKQNVGIYLSSAILQEVSHPIKIKQGIQKYMKLGSVTLPPNLKDL